MSFTRYAIYFVPPEGGLADFGARWLGWDVGTGREAPQFNLPGLDDVTMTPRKYGFHATLKPPFRLAPGRSLVELRSAVEALATTTAPALADGLALSRLGRFLALTLDGDASAVSRVAARCVEALDDFRALAGAEDLARRRKPGLSARQDELLLRWGYPYVMEAFRFHMTLTGRLSPDQAAHWTQAVQAHLPDMPRPFRLDQIALVGERADGMFELVQRYDLRG
ncbi:DUF1045 domain-containing protein [Lutimaribacter sp. EGI FJ00015]|uniref:DUF1045 domain-containing protein n=1 Tax=Lutimaribacter degradans TaxID=2945989 RepID=A0ACC5ZSP3_9RHOB|nr:DUF1045 domain-containing protein [Lutimaribacter sp. EGI FJ00013]MCM2561302.1 DUF1045 domain-containing protein [Lutimaribacter sp. EGI FJ00013]MCO0611747.1 DUF1045 domain-containing protein [Lutimaribacter sp. EGI FJ00015]MCO0635131.1 DUF1045 domain-containing protein [Lutimaribacter sp. EGI FJ00014]